MTAPATTAYAQCKDCGVELADRDAVTAHGRETLTPVTGEGGVTARGHSISIVNPTDEERQATRIRMAIADALDKFCEELYDDVERGYFTADEVKAQMWAYDIDTAWEEYVEEAEDE